MRLAAPPGRVVAVALLACALAPAARAADWTTYLGDNGRSGFAATETGITTANASSITTQSLAKLPSIVTDEPMVVGGTIYLGTWDGNARAINASTGSAVWTRNLGTTTPTCSGSTGVVGSAAVAQLPATTVFMPGGDGQMYALNASDGSVIWQTRLGPSPDVIVWGSPAYANGHVYIGLSSSADCPLVRGGLYELNATTGAVEHVFYTVPSGCTGASVWSTPAFDASDGSIYITTGNHGDCATSEPYAEAIVKLRGTDLTVLDSWKVPDAQLVSDSDFGAGPVLFTATINGVKRSLLGAANKDGWFYVLDRANLAGGVVWEYQLGPGGPSPNEGGGPIAPAEWDGTRLYVAGTNATIDGTTCQGTLRAFDPATGLPAWQDCFADGVAIAAPVGAPGIVTVAAGPAVYVVDAASGATLAKYTEAGGHKFEGPGAISGGSIYYGNVDGQLIKMTPSASPPPPSAPTNVSPPVLSGTGQVGQLLSVTPGAWNGSPVPTLSYAWQDCDADGLSNCTAIGGAGGSTYAVSVSDVGRAVRALVTATNGSGHASAPSNATQPVVAAPPNLLQNGSFENGVGGWTGWQATLSAAGDGVSGPGAALVTLRSGFSSYSIYPTARPVSTTSANQTYTATGQTRAAVAGGKTCLFIREWSSGGSIVATASTCVTETTAWQAFPTVSYTTRQSGGTLEAYAYQTGAAAGASFEVDALTLANVSGPPPPTPPDTSIVSGPSGSTSATSATFTFTSTASGGSFQCALDTAAFATCVSGVTYTALSTGTHTFQVRAVDAGGNTDPTPATRTWTITTPSNLLSNGSFEGSTSGWIGYNATLGVATDGTVGADAALVSLTAGNTSFSIYPYPRPVLGTAAGVAYTAGGFVRAATPGGKVCLYIREWSATGTVVGAPSTCVTATTAWQPFPALSYTTQQGGGSLEVYVYESGAPAGASFEVDGLSLAFG